MKNKRKSPRGELARHAGAIIQVEKSDRQKALDDVRAMFAERVRQPGDIDVDDVRLVTGIKSPSGAEGYMYRLVRDGLYTEHHGIFDPTTGRTKTVWRKANNGRDLQKVKA